MRSTLVVMLLAAASPATAAPAADQRCDGQITIVRAPADVREAVWDALETESCHATLEVRIVPTDGGLYVIARDDTGRLHERVITDVAGVAKVIASWTVDPDPAPKPELAPVVTPPGVTPTEAAPDHVAVRSQHRWLGLAGVAGDGRGIRITADLWNQRDWVIGTSGTYTQQRFVNFQTPDVYPYVMVPELETRDARAMITGARVFGHGTLRLRASLGAGFVYTQAQAMTFTANGNMITSASGVFPIAEAALILERDLGGEWGLDVGLLTTIYDQTLHPLPTYAYDRDTAQWLLVGGLRHRL